MSARTARGQGALVRPPEEWLRRARTRFLAGWEDGGELPWGWRVAVRDGPDVVFRVFAATSGGKGTWGKAFIDEKNGLPTVYLHVRPADWRAAWELAELRGDARRRARERWYDTTLAPLVAHELTHVEVFMRLHRLGLGHAPGLAEPVETTRPYHGRWEEYHAFLFQSALDLQGKLRDLRLRGHQARAAFRCYVGASLPRPPRGWGDPEEWYSAFAVGGWGFWLELKELDRRRWRRAVRQLWEVLVAWEGDVKRVGSKTGRGARRPGTSPGSLLVGREDLHELAADHEAAAVANERLAALLRAQGDSEGAEFFAETARYYRDAAASFGTGRGGRAGGRACRACQGGVSSARLFEIRLDRPKAGTRERPAKQATGPLVKGEGSKGRTSCTQGGDRTGTGTSARWKPRLQRGLREELRDLGLAR